MWRSRSPANRQSPRPLRDAPRFSGSIPMMIRLPFKRVAESLLVIPSFLMANLMAEDALRFSQPEIKLWTPAELEAAPSGSPEKWNPSTDGFHRITDVSVPSLFVVLPPKEKATGTAVVICPGGGHRYLVMDLEGSLVAEKLNAMGIAAFVLKSRLSRAENSPYKTEIHSLQDVQRAIRIVRSRASEWSVDPAKVGIMGFSAGGELAALAETRFTDAAPGSNDALNRTSARPDFAVLCYPALGNASAGITKDTPPTFMVVASDDTFAVPVATYYSKLKAAGVPAEAHIYTKGGHGFGMTGRNAEFRKLPVSSWPDRLQEWLSDQNFLPKRRGS